MIVLKSAQQVEAIKAACRLVKKTLDLLQGHIKAGISTQKLDKIAAEAISAAGGEAAFFGYNGFPAHICTSVNEELVHGIPSERKLKETDIITVDVGVKLNGFYGDAARTYAVSDKIPPEAQKLMQTAVSSLEKGIQQARAGRRLYDVSWAIQQEIEKSGFSVVRQFVGHGIGSELHEDPQIPNFGKPGTGVELKPGMVLAVEPMLNAGGWEIEVLQDGWTAVTKDKRLCAHTEDTIYIGESKTEILTR